MADVPFVMVVPSSLPVKTVQEFIALAKKTPSKLTYGSVGVGTPQHLGGELFKMHAGRRPDPRAVPRRHRRDPGPAGRAHRHVHRRGQFALAADQGRQARALATTGNKRIASLPDVPTMAEAGLPGVEVGSGVGLVAPAGTPPDIVDTLNREIAEIIATPGFHQRMAAIGVDVVGTTPAEYAKIISDDYDKWGKVVAPPASSRSDGELRLISIERSQAGVADSPGRVRRPPQPPPRARRDAACDRRP